MLAKVASSCNLSRAVDDVKFWLLRVQSKRTFISKISSIKSILQLLEAGCRTVSNNGSGSGLALAQNILVVQVWFGFT